MANTIAWYTAAGCLGMNAPGRVWKQEPVEREEIAMQYDIIIVGSGPGGIFSAYELTKEAPELKIAVFEAGHSLEKRRCPIDGDKVKGCIGCKSA